MNQERKQDIMNVSMRKRQRRRIVEDSDDDIETPTTSSRSAKASAPHAESMELDSTSSDNMWKIKDNYEKKKPMSTAELDETNREAAGSAISNLCVCQPDPKIPRPRNAFILYRQHYHSSIVAKHPELTNPEISKIIGEEWNILPDHIKAEWKGLAEEEKVRHSQQYPEYRYQPKRSDHQNACSQPESGTTEPCEKCGRLTSMSQSKHSTGQAKGSIQPPPPTPVSPSATSSSGNRLPSLQELKLSSSQHARNLSNGYIVSPLTATQPNTPQGPPVRYMQQDNDAKRRRYTNGGAYGPVPNHLPVGPQYAMVPVYLDSSGRPMPSPQFSNPPSAALLQPQRPSMALQHRPRVPSLAPAPTQQANDQSRSVEAMVMSMPFLGKIRILGRICPPHPSAPSRRGAGSSNTERGPIIAVEGDNEQAVARTVEWLHDHLALQSDLCVRVAPGPNPLPSTQAHITDYQGLIQTWHRKSGDMVAYVTKNAAGTINDADAAAAAADDPPSPTDTSRPAPQPKPTPVLLMHHYQLHASNVFASRIPIADEYSPMDHWQWMATLWRGTVGPDLTVFVKDCGGDELAREPAVEVRRDDVRCVVVRREREALAGIMDGRTMRRLGFEVGEVVHAGGFGVPARPGEGSAS